MLECRACGLLYKSLLPTDAGLRRIYAGSYEHFQDGGPLDQGEIYSAKQKLASARRLLGAARSPKDIRVLDIGCAQGRFVDLARRLGYVARRARAEAERAGVERRREGSASHPERGLSRARGWDRMSQPAASASRQGGALRHHAPALNVWPVAFNQGADGSVAS